MFAFGIAWITAAAVRATTIQKRVVADLEQRGYGSDNDRIVTALANLIALPWPPGNGDDRDRYKAALNARQRLAAAEQPPAADEGNHAGQTGQAEAGPESP